MDRDQSLEIGTHRESLATPGEVDLDLLPTRRDGRAAIRAAISAGRGPIVLTGEPGVGKTALLASLEAERGADEGWAVVEVTPATGTIGLYQLLARAFRIDPEQFGRVELLDFLGERSLDGERWLIAIDEAHNLDTTTLEEVRVLANRIGRPDGPAAILLVGQTSLARRLEGRALAGFRSKIGALIHLRPLDADEVGILLETIAPGREWPVELVERIHLTSRGKPARVVELAGRVGIGPHRGLPIKAIPAPPERLPVESPTESDGPVRDVPLVGPSKPPIRVGEGMIEVGWQPEVDPEQLTGEDDDESEAFAELTQTVDDDGDGEVEERIDDHYAALQAWQEWAKNQGRHPEIDPGPSPRSVAVIREESPIDSFPNVRAEEEHGFAPLGRLFSRMEQENQAE
jgi:type II secretory pathway predicted ATPase ExeA